MSYNTKNYTEQGGDITHIGGQLIFDEAAKGVQIDQDAEGNLIYNPLTVEPRQFESYQNYGPIPNSEVLMWSELKQNKGW